MESHEIDRLIDDGLARYRRGDIDGALTAWEEVLAEHPREPRAGRYVDYVRAHYEQLTGGGPAPLAELLIPFGLAGGDPSGDYEVEISLGPPPGERLAEPAIDDGWWLARVSHRESVRNVAGAQLQWQLGTPGRWQVAGTAGLRQTASELALLRVGASKDHLDLRLTWEATAREYVSLNVSATRFRTQLDTALGDGLVGALEVGHRFRLDYPDVTIRLSLVRSNYSAERQFDALVTGLVGNSVSDPFSLWIPASSSQANLSVSVGESSNFGQTRAIRPYAEALSLIHISEPTRPY